MGFRRFSFRGLEKVQAEWDLVCLALNVKRLHTLRAGPPERTMAYPVTPVKGPRHPCSPLPPTTQPSRLIGDTPSQPIMTPIRHIPADSAPILSRCLSFCGADS